MLKMMAISSTISLMFLFSTSHSLELEKDGLETEIGAIAAKQAIVSDELKSNLHTIRSDAYQIGCLEKFTREDICKKHGEEYATQKEAEDQQQQQ